MVNILKMQAKVMIGVFAAIMVSGAGASPIILDFEGVGNLASVNDFYNGGQDSAGNSGINYGINFSDSSLAIIDSDEFPGTGNIANETTPSTVLFFLDSAAATMNSVAGFTTGFSFYYSGAKEGFVNVYDGLNGTGNLLASINLAINFDNNGCTGDPTGDFCNFDPIGVSFAGIAHSVDFGGAANFIGFDNITLGASTPNDVPEPATTALIGLGLSCLAASRRKKAHIRTPRWQSSEALLDLVHMHSYAAACLPSLPSTIATCSPPARRRASCRSCMNDIWSRHGVTVQHHLRDPSWARRRDD